MSFNVKTRRNFVPTYETGNFYHHVCENADFILLHLKIARQYSSSQVLNIVYFIVVDCAFMNNKEMHCLLHVLIGSSVTVIKRHKFLR